jgi:RHS repeat-associated protein
MAASGATALADAYRYGGWGQAAGTASTVTGGNPFRFRGAINLGSDASPLYEMGARLYAPSLGTFTQLDTTPGEDRGICR